MNDPMGVDYRRVMMRCRGRRSAIPRSAEITLMKLCLDDGGGGGGGGFRGGGGGGRRSDIALKHDVVLLGHLANGLGYYRFSYLGRSKPYVGVIAQEVQNLVPEAVTRGSDGYLRVHYEQLGLKLLSYTDWLARGA